MTTAWYFEASSIVAVTLMAITVLALLTQDPCSARAKHVLSAFSWLVTGYALSTAIIMFIAGSPLYAALDMVLVGLNLWGIRTWRARNREFKEQLAFWELAARSQQGEE